MKIIATSKCKRCKEPIRWVVTESGAFMPIQMTDNEPHFPHCGKGSWSVEDWADYLIEMGMKMKEKNKEDNRVPIVTMKANPFMTVKHRRGISDRYETKTRYRHD